MYGLIHENHSGSRTWYMLSILTLTAFVIILFLAYSILTFTVYVLWSSLVRIVWKVFTCHSEWSRINGSVASNMLGFKVPLFIGQGLLFLWAFSEKGSPRLFCSFISVIMKLYITYYSVIYVLCDSTVVVIFWQGNSWFSTCENVVWVLESNSPE